MEIQEMQSMDWLFKKERIYLLAQFWQQRATLAEKEVNTLKEQLQSNATSLSPTPLSSEKKMATSPSPNENADINRSAIDLELSAKDREISQLVEDVQRLQSSIGKLQETSASQIARLEEDLDLKRQHILRLEARLEAQRDYEELKRQLRLVRDDSQESLQSKEPNSILASNQISQIENSSSVDDLSPNKDSSNNVTSDSTGKKSTASSIADPDGTIDDSSPNQPTPPQQTSSATSNPNSSPTLNLDQKSPCKSPGDDVTNNNIFVNGGLMNNIFNNNNNSSNNFNDIIKPYRFDDGHHHHHPVYRFANSTGDSNNIMPRFGESLIPKSDPMEARLQEMLRYNMDKYSTQSLDTLYISRRVRELLSVHNVGQRLFAKYILGLSQGTVSELLSKPKPWDKLTEKGRDSYRKMHAWACDENAVMLLKTLIPKKDSTGMHSIFNKSEPDISGDDRLAHILNEAGHLMRHQEQDSRSNDDASPHQNQCPSPLSRENSLNRRLKKYENDDIPQDQVVRIYQEELSKLMGRRFDESQPFPGLLFPHFFNNNLNNVPTNEQEIRLALETYHRELAKLNSTQQTPPTSLPIPNFLLHPSLGGLQQLTQNVQDLSVPKSLSSPADRKLSISSDKNNHNGDLGRLVDSPVDRKDSGGKTPDSVSTTDSMRHQIGSSSAFSLVRPKLEPGTTPVGGSGSAASSPLGSNIILPPEDFSPSAASSPLQRMASITNALISQPSTPHHHSSAQRPLKAVLPPITQQQFDQYNNLNTEDIVRRVKEQLSQFSISQRLFGESVLGLSQGSVSDLLARPKPWHMLTQKGREPFIRMKMFLEDDNAVHKLVASQYKIAPEKLMRTGGYGGPPILPPQAMGKPLQPSPALTPNSLTKNSAEDRDRDSSSRDSSREREREMRQHFMTSPQQQMFAQHHMEQLKKQQQQSQNIPQPPQSPHSVVLQHQAAAQAQAHAQQQVNAALRNLGHHVAPSVYEMAALTQDLDTQVITTKIKEALLANNIGQKIFGEAVLGLSQGSVSELLSKPKPWHMLSIKGREPFIRMQLWLSDSHNVERLQAIKTERRELSKRRRGSGAQENSDDTSSNDTSDFYHGGGGGSPPLSAKKQRVLFSEEQKEALRLAFTLDPYPSVNTIEFLASELNLAARTITNWFHNHRMRLKQHNPNAANSAEINRELPNSGSGGFDPIQFRLMLSQRLAGLNNLNIPPLLTHPYFPGNPEIANLIRGFPNVLNAEQMYGLDLSVKQAEDGMDGMSGEEMEGSEEEGDEEMAEVQSMNRENESSRSSRRKPAAPQWVNPDWQESEPEVIINGVCVMQTSDDYRTNDQSETVRVEPTPVLEDEETEDPPRSHDRSPDRSPVDIKRETSPTPDCNEDLSIKREPERDDESDF